MKLISAKNQFSHSLLTAPSPANGQLQSLLRCSFLRLFQIEIGVSKAAMVRGVFSADAPTHSRLPQPLIRVEEHK